MHLFRLSLPRSIRFIACMSFAALGSHLLAQQEPEEPERFELSACAIGINQVPPLFWKDIPAEGQRAPDETFETLRVGSASRGSVVEIPVQGDLTIYREGSLPPDAAPDSPKPKVPFITIPEPEPDARLLLVFHRGESGKVTYTFLDDSAEVHPANTVRLANFTPRRAVGYVGGDIVPVPSGENRLLGEPVYQEPNRFDFSYALESADGSFSRSQPKRLRFRSPEARLLILMTYLPETEEDEDGAVTSVDYRPIAYRVYDRVR